MSRWTKEADFEKHFYALGDPLQQMGDLAEWREFQTEVVSRFIDQIRLVAGEHYTNLDHFFLELLQNADDNNYAPHSQPTIWITLDEEFFCLENNENGFTDRDLFAITYAAASTKLRQKTKSTFIGEKGIGFKSVFAVADFVDIHSPPYHFRLTNDEFIIPHLISPEDVEGTRIVLRLRQGNPDIPKILSKRLSSLCANAQEFILFLQKIEKLHVEDRVSGASRLVTAVRDVESNFYIVEESTYFTYRYTVNINSEVVRTRFSELGEDLEREIVMAVPYPTKDGIRMERNGRLFCFLPTAVKTNTPIHLQVDAKTTGNRENLVDFDASEWNRTIFRDLSEQFIKMFETLKEKPEFAERLPEYFPWDATVQDTGNKNLSQIMTSVQDKLKEAPIIRDRHGKYWPAVFVKTVPPYLRNLLYEDKYEQALSRFLVQKGEYKDSSHEDFEDHQVVTLVDLDWADRYSEQLEAMGVKEVDDEACVHMLGQGPPSDIDIHNEGQVRRFLRVLLEFGDRLHDKYFYSPYRKAVGDLKFCPVFPLRDGKKVFWGSLTDPVMWIKNADSPDVRGTPGAILVDVRYTYSPGGSASKTEAGEAIRTFNRKFRTLLDACEIASFGVIGHLKRTTISRLQKIGSDLKSSEERRTINELWLQLFQRLWNRKKTLITEEGGIEAWNKVMSEVGRCKIPVRSVGNDAWNLERLDRSFLGPKFRLDDNLAEAYRGTGAPIIELDLIPEIAKKSRSKRQRRVDWNNWRSFLTEARGKTGPYIVKRDLSEIQDYWHSNSSAYENPNNSLASGVRQGISSNREFMADGGKDFSLQKGSHTYGLDKYTRELLKQTPKNDFLARHFSHIWEGHARYNTHIEFLWGSRYKNRSASTQSILLEEELRSDLMVMSDKGFRWASTCFESSSENRRILGELVPYVDTVRRGYNRDLLYYVGLHQTIEPGDIARLTCSWYQITPPDQRHPASFLEYLEMVRRFCRAFPEHLPMIKGTLNLYSLRVNQLIPFSVWKETALEEFPEKVVEELIAILEPGGRTTLDGILGRLIACNPLEQRQEGVADGLIRLGRFVENQSVQAVRDRFEEMVERVQLTAYGKPVLKCEDLPILWDLPPIPGNELAVLAVFPERASNEAFQRGADALGWPRLSRADTDVALSGEQRNLDEQNCRRVFLAFEELFRGIGKGHNLLAKRIDALGIFQDQKTLRERITLSDDVKINIRQGNNHLAVRVPYWFSGEHLFVGSAHNLARVLPEFVDLTCGTTFSSTFRYVWDAAEIWARAHDTQDQGPNSSNPPEHPRPGDNQEDPDNGSKSDLDDGLDDEAGEAAPKGVKPEEKIKERGSGEGSSSRRKRSRLCSLVMSAGKKESPREKEEDASSAENEAVESAGRDHMLDYFKKLGLECKSREAEDVGYDFEVSVGEQVFYVELKSSRDRWDGWEEALSRNEFLKARELREKYFLCVVDRARSDDWSIYFIRDPAGEVDCYLFDHPWKTFSEDMRSYVFRLKAQEGILDD